MLTRNEAKELFEELDLYERNLGFAFDEQLLSYEFCRLRDIGETLRTCKDLIARYVKDGGEKIT